jgi:hypothetical protein
MSLVQSVNAAVPTYEVWDRIFHSEEVAANAESFKRSVEEQITELNRWQAGLEDVYCKQPLPSSYYCRTTERLTCRTWRIYSAHDLH